MKNRRLFAGLFLVNFLITLGFGIADAFFAVYVMSLGARGLLLGLPLGIYAFSKIMLSPFLGAASDLIGRKNILLIGISLYMIVSLSYLWTSDILLIVFVRLLQGAGCAMLRPVLTALISDCAPDDRRAETMGKFDVSFYGALGLGPIIGGILKDAFGFAGIFFVLVFLCAMALGIVCVSIPFCRVGGQKNTTREKPSAVVSFKRSSGQYRTFAGLLVFIFGRACGISLMVAFLPVFLVNGLDLSGTRAGLVIASSTVVMTLLLYPAGKLSDRVSRKGLIFWGGAIVSALYFLIPAASCYHQVLLICCIIGLFSVLSQPASSALLVEEGHRHGMGITLGIFHAVLNAGFVIGPLIGAGISSLLGLPAVFYVAGGMGFSTCLVFFMISSSFGFIQKKYAFLRRRNIPLAGNKKYRHPADADGHGEDLWEYRRI